MSKNDELWIRFKNKFNERTYLDIAKIDEYEIIKFQSGDSYGVRIWSSGSYRTLPIKFRFEKDAMNFIENLLPNEPIGINLKQLTKTGENNV